MISVDLASVKMRMHKAIPNRSSGLLMLILVFSCSWVFRDVDSMTEIMLEI